MLTRDVVAKRGQLLALILIDLGQHFVHLGQPPRVLPRRPQFPNRSNGGVDVDDSLRTGSCGGKLPPIASATFCRKRLNAL
jgi:hypothetical protein